jgi:hypothetical protein
MNLLKLSILIEFMEMKEEHIFKSLLLGNENNKSINLTKLIENLLKTNFIKRKLILTQKTIHVDL